MPAGREGTGFKIGDALNVSRDLDLQQGHTCEQGDQNFIVITTRQYKGLLDLHRRIGQLKERITQYRLHPDAELTGGSHHAISTDTSTPSPALSESI